MNDQTETQDADSVQLPTMASTDWSILLAELSSGMEQLLYQKADGRRGEIYPDSLRRGLSRLSLAMIRAGGTSISSIADAIEVLQRPVDEWNVSPEPPEHMRSMTLMDGDDITDDAENCIVNNPDIAGEWTQQIMKEVVDNCRTRGDQDGYVTFRRCIVERPVATRQELIEVRRKLSDTDLHDKFTEAYEEIPMSSLSEDEVRTCPRCGWTKSREANRDVWRCALGRCRELSQVIPERFPDSRPFTPGMKRVRLGLARYTTRPGGLELRLFRALEEINGVTVELWPHCDAYDIGVTFTNGENWAIDCKDARNPAWLAGHLNQTQFSTLGSWHRAFYVFPGHHRRTGRDYERTFRSRWQPDGDNVGWSFDDDFLKMVKDHLR